MATKMSSKLSFKLKPLVLHKRTNSETLKSPLPSTCCSPTEIIPSLYLSSSKIVSDLSELQKYNIKAIVNVTSDIPNYFEKDIEYLRVSIDDKLTENIEKYFDVTHKFIDEQISKGHSVLVHCQAGISRSATIIISYLMLRNKETYSQVLEYIRSKRSKVEPNLGFCIKLLSLNKNI